MTWMNTLSGWQWAIFGALPFLVLMLYFLKLRRQVVEVPSTFLWRKTIEDIRVNSLWQRLRRNLLLYLQLLFIALLILACLRPGLFGRERTGERWIFLIDHSASMQATDMEINRLEAAKKIVRGKLATMQSSDVAMVMAFSNVADIKQGFTSDKQRLLTSLDSIKPTHRTTDINDSLRAAAGLANPGRASFDGVNDIAVADALPATLFIASDGGFAANNEFDWGNLHPQYLSIGTSSSDNLALVSCSVDRDSERPDSIEVFGRIYNDSREPVIAPVNLYFNGILVDASRVSVAPKQESGVNFQLSGLREGELKLEIEREDILMLDNVAYTALRPPRQANLLLVTPGNRALETALSTEQVQKMATVLIHPPEYLQTEEYQKYQQTQFLDLMIFDQCAPEAMPDTNTLFIGSLPPMMGWALDEPEGPCFVDDWDKTHPVLQYVELASIRIIEGQKVTVPSGGKDLITGNIGTIFGMAPRGPYQDAVLGFPIVRMNDAGGEPNTDWAIRRSFPVFVHAIVEYLSGGTTLAAASTILPGQPIQLTLTNRYMLFDVQLPDGKRVPIQRGSSGQTIFTQTETPGMYRVFAQGGEQPLEVFCVNLFSQQESKLEPPAELQVGADNVRTSGVEIEKRFEFWRLLALLALGVLLIEWIAFNRRVLI